MSLALEQERIEHNLIGVQFDEEKHIYTVDGEQWSSVTQALKCLPDDYAHVSREIMQQAAHLGKAVHKAIELDIAQTLDEESLDPIIASYLQAWREFVKRSGFEVLASESIVVSRKYRYCGKLDILGVLNGRYALVDLKRTAGIMRSVAPQLAGYEQAARETFGIGMFEQVDRYALHFPKERSAALFPFYDKNDMRVFLSALTIHQWSKRS